MSAAEGSVLIGNKNVMNYVLATVIQFNQGAKRVSIKARGRAISRAVDVAEIVKSRFLKGEVDVETIKIGSEQVGEADKKRTISTIEIVLARK
ncbi:MAG: DNA-binding protein Alba [Infirmifilum sp.]|jgi:DNA-binding protein|uniref:DNA/RNA-binding protein Alba n=1 Tax=Infirmifilum uzonense TaxID=1550241 RepID=A0A0F7FII2_9CREN|nr:DNA-binding protein Alba [Infirmifilum uzonense]AKG39023.1 DNA-binding protein [Infirmifilum uzonense]